MAKAKRKAQRKKRVVLTPEQAFEHQIWAKHQRCMNCGGEDGLRIVLLVPIAAGGTWKVSNGALLCRPCIFARDETRRDTTQGERMLTMFPGARLIAMVRALLAGQALSLLVRQLMQ